MRLASKSPAEGNGPTLRLGCLWSEAQKRIQTVVHAFEGEGREKGVVV